MAAQNVLSSIRAAAERIGASVLSTIASAIQGDTPGVVRDGTATAIQLAREAGRQEEEVERLQRQKRNMEFERQAARNALAITEADIRRTVAYLSANNCD